MKNCQSFNVSFIGKSYKKFASRLIPITTVNEPQWFSCDENHFCYNQNNVNSFVSFYSHTRKMKDGMRSKSA